MPYSEWQDKENTKMGTFSRHRGIGRGEAGGILGLIIVVSIGLIFIVNILQPQITNFYNTTLHPQTGWDASVKALWTVIIIAIVIGIVVAILKKMGVLHI